MEVTNRFKRLDPVGRVSEELWMRVHNTVQGAVTETIPPKNKCKKAKWLWRLYKQLRKEEKQKVRDKGKDIPK